MLRFNRKTEAMSLVNHSVTVIYMYCLFLDCCALNIPGFFKWSLKERENVFCPDICLSKDSKDRCCSCEAKPCWELDRVRCPLGELYIEFLDVFGRNKIMAASNTSIAELIHTHGSLMQIPENTCDFGQKLVTLDLRYNKLEEIDQVHCLINLDTLRLDYNLIQYIDNTTFTKMKDLRILTMSNNIIKQLDPNVILVEDGNVPIIDISENRKMDLVDISNIFRPGPFCTLNYTGSYVDHITNNLGFVMEKVMHGPGDLLLEHTHLGSFFNFSAIGISDVKEFAKYITGQIRIDESSINCDCTVYPVLETVGKDIAKYWPNVGMVDDQTFECFKPDYMKGKNLTAMIETMNFDDLVCDITEKPDCPHYYCHCIDMPSQGKVLVNCTGVGLTSMPTEMPIGAWNNYKIDLILADNSITVLPERNYYSRLVNLDLRQNNITVFSSKAADNIASRLNIQDQQLRTLPPILQHRNPNLITFGPHPIVCDCSNTWIGDWIRLRNGQGRLNCSVNGVIIPAEEVSDFTLNCIEYTTLPTAAIVSSAVGVLTLLVLMTGLCFKFRYEFTIIKRTLYRKPFSGSPDNIDVFLSYYEENSDIFRMVCRYIKPELVAAGYTVFVPWQDIPYGLNRDDEIAKAVDRSLNFVIVLCNDYGNDNNSVSELETIWKSFQANKTKQIILINFDNLESKDIRDDRLRAVKRTRCLDFKERNTVLIQRLKNKLGRPLPKKGIENQKKRDLSEDNTLEKDSTSEVESDDLDKINISSVSIKATTVFDRLAAPKSSECNCKYRRCYLHGDTSVLFNRPVSEHNSLSNIRVNRVNPL